MSFAPELTCSGFQLAEYHVPPFQLLAHDLAFVRWPGNSDDPILPRFLRILGGLDPHPAMWTRQAPGIALPLASLVFPERRFPRKGAFLNWVKRELDDLPLQVDCVMNGLAPELKTRPMESTGNGPFYVISVRLQLARSGIAIFTTAGTDPAHVDLIRESVTSVSRDQVQGCGLEILTANSPLGDSEMPQSTRIFITKLEAKNGPR